MISKCKEIVEKLKYNILVKYNKIVEKLEYNILVKYNKIVKKLELMYMYIYPCNHSQSNCDFSATHITISIRNSIVSVYRDICSFIVIIFVFNRE